MQTVLCKATPRNIQAAGAVLRRGGLVAFPTETVYGLGANALSAEAVEAIFKAKQRPADNPLIVHVADASVVRQLASHVTPVAELLMTAFWPGPLTIILPKAKHIPGVVTAGLATVAIRMPRHQVALELIRASGVPIAAPSANISGRPSPTRAEHVWRDLAGKIDCILDGGPCSVGVESTVVDCTESPPLVLRPGGVTLEDLRSIVPDTTYDSPTGTKLRSPGMKYRHYSPAAEVVLFEGRNPIALRQRLLRELETSHKRTAVAGVVEIVSDLPAVSLLAQGSWDSPARLAEDIYHFFRQCDEKGIEQILLHSVPERGIGLALMNRLRKAADRTIDVDAEVT